MSLQKINDDERLALFESIINFSNDAIITKTLGGIITSWNNASEMLFGFQAAEAIGQHISLIIPEDRLIEELEIIAKVKAGENVRHYQTERLRKDGSIIFVSLTVSPLKDRNGNITGASKIARDITRQVQEEQRLKLLESVITNTTDAVLITGAHPLDEPGPGILYINEAFTRMTGYSSEELIGQTPRILQGPKSDPRELQRLGEALRNNQVCEVTTINYKKNGENFWINFTVNPVFNDKGSCTHFIAIERDITHKKDLEILLDKANDLARIGNWEMDLVKNTMYWSDITREIHETSTDYKPEFTSGINFYEEGPSRNIITTRFKDIIEKGITCDEELKIVTAKGNKKWVRVVGEGEFSEGKCVRVYGSFQDIDKLKKAEIAAKEILEERNTILESIDDAFFAIDKSWAVTYWNSRAEKVLDRSKDEVFGKALWEIFADFVGSEAYNQYHLAMETGRAVHFEVYSHVQNNWYEVSAYPSVGGLSIYFKYVTERKKTEMQLQESEKRYSELFHLSPLPMWVVNLETLSFLDVNMATINHYGFTRDEFLSMTLRDIRPAGEIPLLMKVLEENKKKPHSTSTNIAIHKTKNGALRNVELQISPIQFKGISANIVIATDITDRLSYIKAIEEQNEKLSNIAWMQSHVVRAPVARIMGLIQIIADFGPGDPDREKILEYIMLSANELDDIIKEISNNTDNNNPA